MSLAVPNKSTMTEEERLELATKLDDDLERFIDSLEKKRYEEGWPEDRWEEEMDKHPFFMKKAPEIGDDLHPMLEGLQQLKYDDMENTTEDLAATYKEDGNFYMKHKKLRMSIYSYTEGIKMKCQNEELNANLYNNRSAAQFFLKNYRSAIEDANKAIALNPQYLKPLLRAAQANLRLLKYDECTRYCDLALAVDAKHQPALDLRKESQAAKAQAERDARKLKAGERRQEVAVQQTLSAIEARGVRFEQHLPSDPVKKVTAEMLRPCLEPLEDYPAHIEADGSLVWPTAFCYPEFLFSDFHQTVSENVLYVYNLKQSYFRVLYITKCPRVYFRMNDVLTELLAEPLQMDKKMAYRPGAVNIYFENRLTATCHKVNVFNRIADIVTDKK